MPTRRAPLGSSAMARKPAWPRAVQEEKSADTARSRRPVTTPARYDADQAHADSGASLAQAVGKRDRQPLSKVWESTSVMIIPIPMERTIVLLMSTSPLFTITFWNSGAETMLMHHRGDHPGQDAKDQVVARGLQHDPGHVHGEHDHLWIGEVDDHRHQQQEVEAGDQQHVDAAEGQPVDDLGDEDLHSL